MKQLCVFLAALGLGSVVVSCSDSAPATEVVICVSATPQVMARAQTLTIRVFGRRTESDTWVERAEETRPITELPLTLGVHPRGRRVERHFRVEVEARGPDGAIAVARMTSGFVEDETRAATLLLDERCALTCAEDLTCRDGACVDATWATASLSEYAAGSCRASVDAGPLDQGSSDLGADAGDAGGVTDGGGDVGPMGDAGPQDTGLSDMGFTADLGLEDMGMTTSADMGVDSGPPDVGPEDMGWDAGASIDAAVDGGGEVGRHLVMQLSAAAHAECAGGGWILSVYFDAPISAPGQGQPLDIRLPGPAAFAGDLGVSAYCPTSDNYRNWAPFTDQVASAAGFTTMTLDGVNLADAESVVCNYFPTCPFGPASYWTTPRVPLQLSLHGMCVPSPLQCPDWCQSPC